MSEPLVSILIPAYNAEPFLGEAVESALSQTWPRKEIIVIDDGSSDGTLRVARAFERRGVRVLSQENRGQSAAANRAFAESTGDLIKFFDADDLLSPEFVELQVGRLGDQTEYVASAAWARFSSDPSEADFRPESVWRDLDSIDWLVEGMWNGSAMMQCALWLIPRPVLERSGLWDVRLTLNNDFEFFARVLLNCRGVRFAEGARVYYRSGVTSSLSGRRSRPAVESALLSLKLGTQYLLDAENSQRTRYVCGNLLQDFIYNYYPDHPDLLDQVAARVRELGGASRNPSGTLGFRVLRRLVGWRIARRVERWAVRSGLTRASWKARKGRRQPARLAHGG